MKRIGIVMFSLAAIASVLPGMLLASEKVFTNGSGDGKFSTELNWQGSAVPEKGDTIRLAAGTTSAICDIPALEIGGLTFEDAAAFAIEGPETLTFASDAGLTRTSGDLTFNCPVAFATGDHVLTSEGTLTFKGGISGEGNIEVACTMTKILDIYGANSDYTGDIVASNSFVYVHTRTGSNDGSTNIYPTGKENTLHARRLEFKNNNSGSPATWSSTRRPTSPVRQV